MDFHIGVSYSDEAKNFSWTIIGNENSDVKGSGQLKPGKEILKEWEKRNGDDSYQLTFERGVNPDGTGTKWTADSEEISE